MNLVKNENQITSIFKKNIIVYLCSFIMPLVLYIVSLIIVKNYPFGIHNFTIWDMNLQYLDFFSWYKRVLSSDASLIYSFGKSLGGNTIGIYSFYLASPFNLMLYFFEDIQLFVVVIAGLKIAFCGLTSCVYLRKRFERMDSTWVLLLSLCYSFMSYNFKQISNIMWLDGVIMLPIMMLGIYYLIYTERKSLLYLSTLVSILCCWYTAYMSCLFSAFYFLYEVLLSGHFNVWKNLKYYFIKFRTYCATMLLAVMSSMFMFYPTIRQLLQGKGIEKSDEANVGIRCGFLGILKQLVPALAEIDDTSQLNLFCGSIVIVGIALYVTSKKVNLKEKIVTIFLLVALINSARYFATENIWNGFRAVNSYYCRFSFVICFFMIFNAATYFSKLEIRKNEIFKKCVIGFLVVAELGYNANIYLSHYSYVSTNKSNYYRGEMNEQLNEIKNQDNNLFYRIDQDATRGMKKGNYCGTYNEGMAYGFSSLASYSSAFDKKMEEFYIKCGYSDTDLLIMHHEPILPSESLLGLKYQLGINKALGYNKIPDSQKHNKKLTYINPYALSLGYIVNDTIFEDINAVDTFDYQNKLLSKMIGHEVDCLKKIDDYVRTDEKNKMTFIVKSPKCENVLYGYFDRGNDIKKVNQVDLYINDSFRTNYSKWTSYKTFQISDDESGASQKIELRGEITDKKSSQPVFYYLDINEFRQVINELKENQLSVTEFEDGKVSGNINVDSPSKLLLTIPYDEGWSATINGKKVDILEAQNLFSVIDLQVGNNEIEMRYSLPGLPIGYLLSLVGIVSFSVWEKNKKRKKRNIQ